MEAIQFIQVDPSDLVKLIVEAVNVKFKELKEGLTSSEDLLTKDQTLKLLGIDSSTLWRWTRDKRISAYKIHNKVYYKRSEIEDSLIKVK